jgi:hypothetical protein
MKRSMFSHVQKIMSSPTKVASISIQKKRKKKWRSILVYVVYLVQDLQDFRYLNQNLVQIWYISSIFEPVFDFVTGQIHMFFMVNSPWAGVTKHPAAGSCHTKIAGIYGCSKVINQKNVLRNIQDHRILWMYHLPQISLSNSSNRKFHHGRSLQWQWSYWLLFSNQNLLVTVDPIW